MGLLLKRKKLKETPGHSVEHQHQQRQHHHQRHPSSRRSQDHQSRGNRHSELSDRTVQTEDETSIRSGPSIIRMRPPSSSGNGVVSPIPRPYGETLSQSDQIDRERLASRLANPAHPIENAGTTTTAPPPPPISISSPSPSSPPPRPSSRMNEPFASQAAVDQDPAIAVTLMRESTNGSNANKHLAPPDRAATKSASSESSQSNHNEQVSPGAEQPPRSESGGFISSLFSAAASKMIAPHPDESKDTKKKEHSFVNKLDSLIKGVKHDDRSLVDESEAGHDTDNVVEEQTIPQHPNDPARSDSAKNIHFEPVRESPLNTLGSGDLSLADFDNNYHQQHQQQQKHSMSASRQPSMRSNDGHAPNLKRNMSPDAVNDTLPSGNQLQVVTNGTDVKRVRRKSLNGSAPLDRNGSISKNSQISANGDDRNNNNLSEVRSKGSDEALNEHSDSEPENLDHIVDYNKEIKRASRKSNKEFHQAFKKIPKNEKLIEDFSCALSKDILVQGKMYLSDHYICFNSNILGWVTHLVIPLQEVIQIEKRSTAVLFPNGMIIRTLHQKYVFATFLSRDSAFDLITNVWHRVLLQNSDVDPSKLGRTSRLRAGSKASLGSQESGDVSESADSSDDEYSGGSDEDDDRSSIASEDEDNSNGGDDENSKDENGGSSDDGGEKWKGFSILGPATHDATESGYTKESGETSVADEVIKAPPGVVFELMFGQDTSYFMRILKDQKNFDIDESAIHGLNKDSKSRHYTYTKPLSGPIGPKQTKCVIDDAVIELNPEKVFEVEQTTQTPDVPSGNAFKVKTKIFLTWAEKNSTKISVMTSIEWSGKSWIKGAIEKGTIDGQKESMKEMIETINSILAEGAGKKGGAGGSSKRRSTRSRRNTEKKEEEDENAAKQKQQQEAKGGLSQQLVDLVNSVGDMVPIPMVSNTITGSIIVVISFLLTIFVFNKLGGALFGSGPQKAQFEIVPSNVYTSRIKINNHDYLVIPTINTNFANERKLRQQEINIWNWLESRSDGEFGKHYKLKDNTDESTAENGDAGSRSADFLDQEFGRLSDGELKEKINRQELQELLRVQMLELQNLQKRLNELDS
ncbi:uncharacterized protein LODBEIA_P02690 [Lodderomyces beijingensis]|uniref:VASt domain-containing protein n=1 Tax=Lodderomyces beijingensis TaxID=1775926 RepID=A0ABP0ZI85_9ASCO